MRQKSAKRRFVGTGNRPSGVSRRLPGELKMIADILATMPRTRRWWVTDYGRKVLGTTMYLREHCFPNVYAVVMN
jgi:hypothetical protein